MQCPDPSPRRRPGRRLWLARRCMNHPVDVHRSALHRMYFRSANECMHNSARKSEALVRASARKRGAVGSISNCAELPSAEAGRSLSGGALFR